MSTVYSLSEIEAQAKKAVRGVGFAWGHAEEAAKAVRWLAARDLPGPALLAAYLKQYRMNAPEYQAPLMVDLQATRNWRAGYRGTLCPFQTGAFLCDQGLENLRDDIGLQNLAYPLLLVPYFASLTRHTPPEQGVLLTWKQQKIHCQCEDLWCSDKQALRPAVVSKLAVEQVTIDQNLPLSDYQRARSQGQAISQTIWSDLGEFAQLTYVPASEASRAGAGPDR